ncbi:MAG: acetylxylan esterase [Lentisphaeria bacterium]|nr:acetylxylan esterase [Lentisphaeria bacterium]
MDCLIPYGDMLQNFYARLADSAIKRRRDEWSRITTPDDARAYVARARERVRRAFAPIPKRTAPKPQLTGELLRDGVRMQKVIIEVMPGWHATLLVYRRADAPASERQPAILHLCGHNAEGKSCQNGQRLNLSLAHLGMTAVTLDPFGQGERKQFPGLGFSPVREHNLAGKLLDLEGEFFGAWRVRDAMSAVDYLLTRADIDPERIGVTGTSGGGTLASYAFALDERIAAGAPACYITTFNRNFANELPVDAEQVPPGLWADGADMADLLIARAPAPALILAVENDFFDARGAAESHTDLQRIHDLLGTPERVGLLIGPGGHGLGPVLREATCQFFATHFLGKSGKVVMPQHDSWAENELIVTATGQVADLPGEGTIAPYLQRRAATLAAARRPTPEAIAQFLRESLKLQQTPAAPDFRVLRGRGGSPRVSHLALQTAPDCEAILHITDPVGALFHLPAEENTFLYVAHLDADSELASPLPGAPADVKRLYALDVRGIGKSRPLTCDHHADFFAMYDSDYFYDANGRLLSSPLCGGRVHDVLAAVALLRSRSQHDLSIAGYGLGALLVAYAMGISTAGVARIHLAGVPRAWSDFFHGGDVRWPQSIMIPGMLRVFDLPDLYAALAKRCDLTVSSYLNAMLQPE